MYNAVSDACDGNFAAFRIMDNKRIITAVTVSSGLYITR
jgi:hypothetical protein